jgi:dihydroorotase-like cyclic amidohydrolase
MDVVEQRFWKVDDRSPGAYAKTLAAYDGLIWDSAVGTILRMAEATKCRLHVVHTQTTRSIDMIRRAREAGVDVSAEVNHWALFLGRWSDVEEQGAYVLSYWVPDHHREAVWEALNDGTIDMLSSDHAPHTREEKDVGWEDTWAAHTGTPGIQHQLPLMIDAWHEGLVGLETIAASTAENPAATFGLKDKGSITVGKDADLVIVDPDAEWTISNDDVLSRCGWTPYNGRTCRGRVDHTMVRGVDVYREGKVVGQPGFGKQARPTL